MIQVREITQLNSNTTVLVCDMFSDDIVTKTIKTNFGTVCNFVVETPKECFSVPKTRDVLVYGLGCTEINEIEFI